MSDVNVSGEDWVKGGPHGSPEECPTYYDGCHCNTETLVYVLQSQTKLWAVAHALLMFHSGGPWDEEKRQRWKEFTGEDEATTKVLCDLARRALHPPG